MEQFFELSDTGYNLRGHSKRLTVNRCRLDSRKYFFSDRVVQHWNKLTQEIVDARSVNVFKNRLDRHWQDSGHLKNDSSQPIINQVSSKYLQDHGIMVAIQRVSWLLRKIAEFWKSARGKWISGSLKMKFIAAENWHPCQSVFSPRSKHLSLHTSFIASLAFAHDQK